MSAVILRAIVQKDDIPYIERFLKGIATNITFEVEPETSISEELEIELKERYMDFRKGNNFRKPLFCFGIIFNVSISHRTNQSGTALLLACSDVIRFI